MTWNDSVGAETKLFLVVFHMERNQPGALL